MDLVDVCIYVCKELNVVVKHYILILCNFPLETPHVTQSCIYLVSIRW